MAGRPGRSGGSTPALRVPATFRFIQRKGPLGRRYEVRDLDKAVIGYINVDKESREAVFHACQAGGEDREAFRIAAREPSKTFAYAYDVLAPGSDSVGEVRKKEYRSVRKEEWFLFDADGEPVGMVTKDPPRLGAMQELGAFRLFFPITYRLHWGQTIVGTIQDRTGLLLNDHMDVDLTLVRPDDLDDRLVLGAIYCLREGGRLNDLAGLKAAEPTPTP